MVNTSPDTTQTDKTGPDNTGMEEPFPIDASNEIHLKAPLRARKGRGAVSNRSGRFEATTREPDFDGWTDELEVLPDRTSTILGIDTARTVISRNDSPDIPFNQSINPYKGCEHGCIYCFARPTHAYLGLSPGLDFETRIFRKPDAAALLRRELSRPGYRPQTIAMGTNTDPYQPIEKSERIMRSILEVLHECHHPLSIVTKNALILRDIDLLEDMAKHALVGVSISITTLDHRLANRMEPRASTPTKRLAAIRTLADAGVPVSVLTAPMIPGLNDQEMEAIMEAARDAGATGAGYIALRLPLEIKDLFIEWLHENYPDRAEKVLTLIRDMRGGKLYDSAFGTRMRGTGVYADMLSRRFKLAVKRLGLDAPRTKRDFSHFRKPEADPRQMRLFEA